MSSKTYSTPFWISLPSYANHAMHPDNLAGKFTVELPVTIQLDHGLEWELALEEMFWPIHGDCINQSTLWMEIHWPITLWQSYKHVSILSEHLSDSSGMIAFLKSKFNGVLLVGFDEVLEMVKFTYIGTTSEQLRVCFPTVKSHNQCITSVGLEMSEEDQNLPYLYWTTKLHKSPYKHRFIDGSSKCTTKDLSCLLTKVLSTIKDGLVRYCNTKTSHNGVNNMWILKNSTSLLSSLDQLDVRTATSVQTFDFSTLYTSIPHDLLKSRISNLVHNAFRNKDGSVRYTHIKVTRAKGYFTHDINGGRDGMYTADNICKMIEFLIDNIFVQFGGRLFHQIIGIPVGMNCSPLLADLFLYSYENEFLDNMIRSGHRRLSRSFNRCYDLIVFNNKKFLDYLKEIYPSQLTVEKATKSDHLADYLDLTFIIDSGGRLSTRLYDKRDDFDFHIVNFPFLSSNIPSGPSYGVYISQLIRYARCCSHYDDFRYHHKCLVDRGLSQGCIALRLEKSFKNFYGRYQDLIEKYQRSVNVMVDNSFPG